MTSRLPEIPEMSSPVELLQAKHLGHSLAVLRPERRVLDGPQVAFIPGILSDVTFWPRVVPAHLLDRWDWVSLSLPCHYPSVAPADFVHSQVGVQWMSELVEAGLREAFGDKPAQLIGWSTGGFASLVAASYLGDRVRSVLSISGFVRGKWGSLPGLLQRLARLGRTGKWIFSLDMSVLARWPSLYQRIYRWMAASSPDGDELQRAFPAVLSCVQESDRKQLAQLFAGLRGVDASQRLSEIACPMSFIGGLNDRVIPHKELEHMLSLVSETDALELEDCGHLFFWEQPERSWRFIEDWVERNA